MANDLDLKVRISAELGEIKSALAGLQGDLRKVNDEARKGSGNRAFEGMRQSLGGIKSELIGLAAQIGAAFSTKAVIDMSDQAKLLEGRLRLVTKTHEELIGLQTELFNLSQRTRGDLASTVEMYTRLARSTQDTTASQGQLIRVTETINKAIQVSGASAQEAQAAIIQLSQGLASGALRGDELRSVLEQMPRLAQAIAAGMGKSVGELRSLGEQGLLTTDQIINALLKQAQAVDEEFAKMPLTVGASLTELKNSFSLLVGQLDSAKGATGGLADEIKGLADYVSSGQLAGGFIKEFGQIGSVVAATAREINDALDFIDEAIGGATESTFSFGDAFANLPANIRAAVQIMAVEIGNFVDETITEFKALGNVIVAALLPGFMIPGQLKKAAQAEQDELKRLDQARLDSIQAILDERDAHINAGKEAKKRFDDEQNKRKELAKQIEQQANQANADVKQKKTLVGNADTLKLQQAETQAALQQLDVVFSEGKTRLEDYYAQKRRLSAELAQIEIQEAERAVSKANDQKEKDTAVTALELAKRKAAAVQANIDQEERNARKKRDDEVKRDTEKLQVDLANIEGRKVDARMLQIEQKYRDSIERMKKDGNTAGIALAEQLFNKEKVQARFDDIRDQHQKLLDDLRKKEESYSNRVRIGDLTQSQADRLLRADRANARQAGDALVGQAQSIAGQNPDNQNLQTNAQSMVASQDQLKESATGLTRAYQELDTSVTKMQESFASDSFSLLADGIGTAFGEWASGAKTARQAFDDMARSFAQSIAKMAAEILAKKAILSLMSSFGIGTVGAGGAAGAAGAAAVHHTGGIVGRGGAIRMVNPAMFAMAPRYHSGGVAGLAPGEVPAILQKGEEVLAKNDPRNAANGGGQGGGSGVRIINTIDPNMVSDYLASSQGEQVILNVLQRNAGAVRQAVG